MIDHAELERLVAEGRVKLMIVEGRPIWEAWPGPAHQMTINNIRKTIQAGGDECVCYDLRDTDLRLSPEGRRPSLLRPDIAIYCTEPPDSDDALELVPAAVIEVVSPDSVVKDLEELPPAYLRAGVHDVIVFDPAAQAILWFDQDTGSANPRRLLAPHTMTLRCGCTVMIA
jgi:Uma2 family endonuclease